MQSHGFCVGPKSQVPSSALDGQNVDLAFETLLIEIYRIVRKNLEAGKYDPARPAPSIHRDAVAARDAARAEADALRTKCAAAEADAAARPSAGALRDAADARDRAMRDAEDLRRRLDECEGDLKGLRIHKEDAAKARDEAERKLREHDARVLRAEKSINDIEAAADARVAAAEEKIRELEAENAAQIGERVAAAIRGERLKIEREFRDELAAARAQVKAAERLADEERDKRRKLHNRVMELQGNIRVMCRARPPRRRAADRER